MGAGSTRDKGETCRQKSCCKLQRESLVGKPKRRLRKISINGILKIGCGDLN